MRNKIEKNKIDIPWYRRNVKGIQIDEQGINSGFNFSLPPVPSPRPRPATQPARQPARQPATQPATEPATNPVRVPFGSPQPSPNPLPFPDWANPFPYPEFPNPFPFPRPYPDGNRQPAPQTPQPIPTPAIEPAPEPSFFEQTFGSILKPILWLFIAREVVNQYVEANITDPIYNAMYNDPVLGLALREAEKAELDMQVVATYFANYDWDNMDIQQMTEELTALVGAAAAARIIIFFVGRKVVFRI